MTRTCPDCGRPWDGDGRWCGACGAPLPAAPPSQRPGRRTERGTTSLADRGVVGPLVGVLAATLVAALLGVRGDRDDTPHPAVEAGAVVDGEVDVPTTAAAATEVGGPDVPLELLATCDGPDGAEGCVRWVQRAGQLARPGTEPLVTVVADQLVALDPDAGRRRWSAPVSTPAMPPTGVGDHTVLVEDAVGVRALDADDGDERWRVADQHLPMTGPQQTEPSVVVLDDLQGTVTGIAVEAGEVRWSRRMGASSGWPVTVVVVDPRRVLVTDGSALWMLDAGSGTPRWTAGVGTGQPAEVAIAVTSQHVVSLRHPEDDAPPVLRVRTTAGRLLVDTPLAIWDRVLQLAITGAHLVLRTPDEIVAVRLDTGEVAWRRGDLRGPLAVSRTIPLAPIEWMRGQAGFGQLATRTYALVVLDTNGTGTVLEPRNGRDARTFGEQVEGVRLSTGFLTRRHLWRLDADSLEVVNLASLEQVLRIEVRAPPVVVSTNPVVVATSGRLVRLDATSPTGHADEDDG